MDTASSLKVVVRREAGVSETGEALIARLSAELGARYGDDGSGWFHPDDVRAPGAAFVTAWLGEQPVGCGALRALAPGVAEVKRMYTDPAVRGRGVARAVLAELERIAAAYGYHTVRLETGVLQPEAIRLYERAGYHRIACYGAHAGHPQSVCFEKHLTAAGNGDPLPAEGAG